MNGAVNMQNSFTDFTDAQSYVKIGRCISTGDLVFMPEASNSGISDLNTVTLSDAPYEYLHFDPFFMFNELLSDEELQDMLFKLPGCRGFFSKDTYPEICFLAELIFAEYHKQNTHYEDSIKGLLLALLAMLTRNSQNENNTCKNDSPIQSALLFIHNNYADKLSIADIAKNCCNLSESHFRRRFFEVLHTSPLDYINTLRIHKACLLIYHSEMHINEIAQAVGFTTLSSFNRQFQTLCGTSPTKWRKEHSNPISQIRYTMTGTC